MRFVGTTFSGAVIHIWCFSECLWQQDCVCVCVCVFMVMKEHVSQCFSSPVSINVFDMHFEISHYRSKMETAKFEEKKFGSFLREKKVFPLP